MRVEQQKTRPSFGSLNSPIKNFRINTPMGRLYVQEIRLKEKSIDFAYKISKFFNDNFIDGSTDPLWKKYLKPEKALQYHGKNQRYANYLKNLFKNDDGNTTILLARDGKNDIKAAILTLSYNETPTLKDSKLFNMEALAVDKAYRNQHIGQRLIEKVLESARKTVNKKTGTPQFSDAIMTGYEKAVPLYKKLGFRELEQDTYKKRLFYKELTKERDDIPQYVKLLYMPLDNTAQRFYERVNVLKIHLNNFKESILNLFEKI